MLLAVKGFQVLDKLEAKMTQQAKVKALLPLDLGHPGLVQAPGLNPHKLPLLRTPTGKKLANPLGNLLGLAHRHLLGITPPVIGLPIGIHVGGPTALPPGNQTLGMLGTRTNGNAKIFLFATPVLEAQAANWLVWSVLCAPAAFKP